MSWSVGQKLKSLQKSEITRDQLQEYAQASGDQNPIHLDDSFAKSAGFPSVIAHGMVSMAFLTEQVLLNFSPPQFALARCRARFRKPAFPGDILTVTGEVKEIQSDGAIVVSNRAMNQRNETVSEGEALLRMRLPQ